MGEGLFTKYQRSLGNTIPCKWGIRLVGMKYKNSTERESGIEGARVVNRPKRVADMTIRLSKKKKKKNPFALLVQDKISWEPLVVCNNHGRL